MRAALKAQEPCRITTLGGTQRAKERLPAPDREGSENSHWSTARDLLIVRQLHASVPSLTVDSQL